MTYRNTASFGKRHEYIAIAELLKRGLDVYATLVDDQQIDCVVRKEVRGRPVYMDIQIKARSKEGKKKNGATFSAMKMLKPRKNFFFIFYSEHAGCYWIFPSLDLAKEANRNKTGKNAGLYSVVLANYSQATDLVRPRPRFAKYQDNFAALLNFKG